MTGKPLHCRPFLASPGKHWLRGSVLAPTGWSQGDCQIPEISRFLRDDAASDTVIRYCHLIDRAAHAVTPFQKITFGGICAHPAFATCWSIAATTIAATTSGSAPTAGPITSGCRISRTGSFVECAANAAQDIRPDFRRAAWTRGRRARLQMKSQRRISDPQSKNSTAPVSRLYIALAILTSPFASISASTGSAFGFQQRSSQRSFARQRRRKHSSLPNARPYRQSLLWQV